MQRRNSAHANPASLFCTRTGLESGHTGECNQAGRARGDAAAVAHDLLTSEKYSSGSGDPHAHLLGPLQWEYCASILDQVCDAPSSEVGVEEGVAKSASDSLTSPADPRIGKFVVLLSHPSDDVKDKKKRTRTTKGWNALPPRLARIAAGNNCDDGHVNVVMYGLASGPSLSDGTREHTEHSLKSFVYVPKPPPFSSSSSLGLISGIPCKGGRRDRFTDTEMSSIVSIPETQIAHEIAPFDLSRHGNIDPSRLPSIRATNLHRLPKRSKCRPFPTRAHVETRLKHAEVLHAVVSKHRPAMPGAPDTYRSLQFSDPNTIAHSSYFNRASIREPSLSSSRVGKDGGGKPTLEKRIGILFQKIVALRRETPRCPSLREWEQCLRGIQKSAKKLAEFVSDMDAPLVLKAHKDLFDLIQIALQSGPMAGSKPGKNFPNSNVAVVAAEFLDGIAQSVKDGPLQFSEAQQGRLSKWHARANFNCKDHSSTVVAAPSAVAVLSVPLPGEKTNSSVRTKVNKKKLSAKEKGRLRRERKQASVRGGRAKVNKNGKSKNKKKSNK